MGVELALAIVATVDLAFKYGDMLLEACANFKAAEHQISALIIRIESAWLRTKYQLEFLQKVVRLMQDDHQRNQQEILNKLNESLQITISQLKSVVHKDQSRNLEDGQGEENVALQVKRFKYVFKKEKLDKTVEDLESWQRLFDPSWFLIMTIADPVVDQKLADVEIANNEAPVSKAAALRSARDQTVLPSGIFRSMDGIDQSSFRRIEGSAAATARRNGSTENFILDPTACPAGTNIDVLTENVRNLAKKLMKADPSTFGLLRSKGIIKKTNPGTRIISEFLFIFEIPKSLSEPCGLRSLLVQGNHYHSLSERLQIAKDLARSVNYIHIFGYVHKNIRSENILIFKDGKSNIGSAFLVGFEEIRMAGGGSLGMGDSILERDVYRHPDRQGPRPREYYVMQHDIYSLGVCLLEIGLWVSLADTLTSTGIRSSSATPAERIMVKDQLLKETRENLPRKMGMKYAKVVETCLTCLDEGNEDFGDESVLRDEDGVLVSVRYIEKVLERLEIINM